MHDPDGAQAWLKEMELIFLGYGLLCNIKSAVTEYAARFVELAKFYPHYDEATAEFYKCIKFENSLRPEIKRAIKYKKICKFLELVDSCRIYEEDNKAHYKSMSERRGKQHQNRGKRYTSPANKGKLRVVDGKNSSGEALMLTLDVKDVVGHEVADCEFKVVVCLNCGEEGHISDQCQKPKRAQTGGKVFVSSETQKTNEDNLISGTCFINGTPLLTIIDTGATHCFIVVDYVKRLGLVLSFMNGEMIVDTTANGPVTTYLICLQCPLSMFDRDFAVDLICLLLSGLDVILGMNFLECNYVHISCYNKLVRFSTSDEEKETEFLPARQFNELMKDEVQVFALMASLIIESKATIDELPVVREFAKVFPDVPPEREVEFTTDLVPGTRHVSMASYSMSASVLVELNKHLEGPLD
ncbi:uncharacterized protein LOC131623281 [Vicia villosa]|uniref:uncharacterized protein LOC131623281 n=1 Tax=Vicia villosa TaxID=3911 RepID=UPI00273AEEE3|nr:uncharacterized protein LOC131623281 [Vicia villosa]